jgi:hypothetical protein
MIAALVVAVSNSANAARQQDTFVTTCAKIRDLAIFFAGDAGNMRLHQGVR